MTALLLALAAAAAPARAARTEAAPRQTYWDQIMEQQSMRDLREGSALLEDKRYDESLKYLARAAVQTPNDPLAHEMLGTAYYWTGRVDLAESEFREALRLGADAQGHLLMGIVQAWKGDDEAAMKEFLAAADMDPKRADIQMNIGSIEEGRGRYQEALERFRRAVELDPEHPLYRFQLGMVYRRLGRDDEAASELKQALKLFPGYQDAVLELGALEERAGSAGEARDLFDKAVKLKDRDAVARFRLARLLLAAGKREQARDVLRGVFRLTPADRGGGLALSVSYGGSPAPAAPPSSEPAAAQPPPDRGEEGALGVVARNLERVPLEQQAELDVDLAFLGAPPTRLVKREDGDASSLKHALEQAGTLPAPPISGGRRHYTLPAGSPEERRAQIAHVLGELKDAMAQAPPGARTRFGMNLRFSDKPAGPAGGPGADAASKPKVAYQPRDVGNDLGLWVMGTGWMELIEEVQGDPAPAGADPALWQVVVGLGRSALGDAPGAAAAFEAALELDPRSELAYLGRGVAMVIRGDEDGALAAYKRALAVNPKSKTAAEALAWLERAPAAPGPEKP